VVKCASCGRFISYCEMEDGGGAKFYFEPASHFGPEITEWNCKECVAKEAGAALTVPREETAS
jgi:hypothetical protein